MTTNGAGKHKYTVLVTGFGANANAPYGNASSNPAGDVARMMPSSITLDDPLNSSDVTIEILDGVTGGWATIPGQLGVIRNTTKDLHSQYGDTVDLWIHLGRGPWEHVTCERRAYRQDFTSSWLSEEEYKGYYLVPDNAKQNVNDLGPCPWMQVPMGLNSEVDINAVVVDANASLKKKNKETSRQGTGADTLEVKSHVEAGPAGCGFIFYESMANCFVAGKRRDVLFCHIPRHEDKAALERARDAVLAIISASVDSIIRRKSLELADTVGRDPKAPPQWKVKFGEQL